MPKYDVTDEAIINARPEAVYQAVVNELEGKTSWWMPYLSSKLRVGDSARKIGAVIDLTVYEKIKIKFTAKVLEARNNEVICVIYIGGAFRGEGIWKFESLEGKTKVSFRWLANPAGLLRILALFLPIEKKHSDVMKTGLNNLNEFLA